VNLNERMAAYRASGWNGYREDAPPYTQEEIAAERRRWMEFN
jgi:hypothetical protein